MDHLVNPTELIPKNKCNRPGAGGWNGTGQRGLCAGAEEGLLPLLVPGPTQPLEDQPLLLPVTYEYGTSQTSEALSAPAFQGGRPASSF